MPLTISFLSRKFLIDTDSSICLIKAFLSLVIFQSNLKAFNTELEKML